VVVVRAAAAARTGRVLDLDALLLLLDALLDGRALCERPRTTA
jgi:hypothetical protein